MKRPWFRYRKVGGPVVRIIVWWWPNAWQGWLCTFGLAVLWIGGGNTITGFVFPENAKAAWTAIAILTLISLALFHFLMRYTGEDMVRKFRDED